MKKILSIAAALLVAAAFISCGDSSDSFDGATDTVITISAPSVTGKAYPGVNYITWTPVTGAGSYELYRSDDGDSNVLLSVVTPGTVGAKLGYADIAAGGTGAAANTALTIADGKTYKYTVLAIGGNSTTANVNVPSRAVYLKGNQSSVSVKAIVPTAGTSVGDIKEYKSFFEKFNDKNLAKNVVITKTQYNKKTTVGTSTGWLGYYVSYPATAGLKFAVTSIEETGVDANGGYIGLDEISGLTDGNYKENFTANAKVALLGSGDKDIYVKVESVADTLYQPIVKKVGTIEVKGINESSATSDVNAVYRTAKTDTAAATAEIYWTPAKLTETGKETDTKNYIVYRKTTKDNNDDYTVVAGVEGKPAITAKKVATPGTGSATVTVGDSTEGTASGSVTGTASKDTVKTVYTFTDTIDDVSATYKYYVVHKIDDLYGAAATAATLTWSALTTGTPTIAISAKEAVQKSATDKNELQILVKKANAAQTLTLKYASLAKDYKDSAITTFTDFTNTAKLENYAGDNLTYVAYVTVANYTDYVFQVEATETGKDPAYAYDQFSKGGPALNGNPTAYVTDDDDASDLKYGVVVTDPTVQTKFDAGLDSFENYTYVLYKVTTAANRYFEDYVTVTEEKVGEITLGALTDANVTKYRITGTTKEAAAADTTGNIKATYVSVTAVTAPKPTDDANGKYAHTESVRFYVVKTLKTDAKTTSGAVAVTNTTGKFTNVKVK